MSVISKVNRDSLIEGCTFKTENNNLSDNSPQRNKRDFRRVESLGGSVRVPPPPPDAFFKEYEGQRQMLRPSTTPEYKTYMLSSLSNQNGGITVSDKQGGDVSSAELETVKHILTREFYLKKISDMVRTVQQKYKNDLSYWLDCFRASSIDVVDAVLRWREALGDHHAAFVWNEVNYLLKMPSDLDFVDEFPVIRAALFPLVRNPFCIPFPLEEGVPIFAEIAMNPRAWLNDDLVEGYILGGITIQQFKRIYSPPPELMKVLPTTPNAAVKLLESLLIKPKTDIKDLSQSDSINSGQSTGGLKAWQRRSSEWLAHTDVLDEPMSKLRQAELVILKEEARFGQYSRDPNDRIIPRMQALARRAAIELRLDDYRPISQNARSILYAPHAYNSDIGAEEQPWLPNLNYVDPFSGSKYLSLAETKDAEPYRRGQVKLGGILSPHETKSLSTREHRPLKLIVSSQIDFRRAREKQRLIEQFDKLSSQRRDLERSLEVAQTKASLYSQIEGAAATSVFARLKRRQSNLKLSLEESSTISSVSKNTMASKAIPSRDLSKTQKKHRSSIASIASVASLDINSDSKANDLISIPVPDHADNDSFNADLVGASDDIKSLEDKLKKIVEKELKIQYSMFRMKVVADAEHEFKKRERDIMRMERSRGIERKRRLLTEQQGRRKIPYNETSNILDSFAIRIQALIRGFLGRKYVVWYRTACVSSAIAIQRCLRGWLDRWRIKMNKRRNLCATCIQRVYRGWKARLVTSVVSSSKLEVNSAILIQRVVRGWLGRKRFARKKEFDEATRETFNYVDEENLTADDVRELGERIENAIADENTQGKSLYPSEEILLAIKITTIIIQSSRGSVGFASCDFINQRYFKDIDGETMGWVEAGKLCVRSKRFMHIIRSLSYGPTSKPPRILHIPQSASRYYYKLAKMEGWNLLAIQTMGPGARFCTQLFKWLNALISVGSKQSEYIDYLTSTFPEWLRKLYGIQKLSRKNELLLLIRNTCKDVFVRSLADLKAPKSDSLTVTLSSSAVSKETQQFNDAMSLYLEKEIRVISSEIDSSVQEQSHYKFEEERLKHDQTVRERYSVTYYEAGFIDAKRQYERLYETYKHDERLAILSNSIHSASTAKILASHQRKLDNQKMVLEELETQMKLLLIQIGKNDERRRLPGNLPDSVRDVVINAGHKRAEYLLAQCRCKALLKQKEVKSERFLSGKDFEKYQMLNKKENELKGAARKALVEADELRVEYDEYLDSRLEELMTADSLSNDQMMPSEEQLQEERIEDDQQATRERDRRLQFISANVLQNASMACKNRTKPFLVVVSRYLSENVRSFIYSEFKRLLVGVLISFEELGPHCGLDIEKIQDALSQNKNVMLVADIGLTYATGQTFIQTLRLTVEALNPSPDVVVAVASEVYAHSNNNFVLHGRNDYAKMRDGNIKLAIDMLTNTKLRLLSDEAVLSKKLLGEDFSAPSLSVKLVVEAYVQLLLTFSEGNKKYYIRSPENPYNSSNWHYWQQYLRNSPLQSFLLKRMRRGYHQDFDSKEPFRYLIQLMGALKQYKSHSLWPQVNSTVRLKSNLVNDMCLLVEAWLDCERLTMQGGGLPPPIFLKENENIKALAEISEPTGDGQSMCDAVCQLVCGVLNDFVVAKTNVVLNSTIYKVTIFRERDHIIFKLFNPQNSEGHLCLCLADTIPHLLAPNAKQLALKQVKQSTDSESLQALKGEERFMAETSQPFLKSTDELMPSIDGMLESQWQEDSLVDTDPPSSVFDMYEKLCKLLLFNVNENGRKELKCKRKNSFLKRAGIHTDGYEAIMTCCEAALGELEFQAFIPIYPVTLTFQLRLQDRLALFRNADPVIEKHLFDCEDVSLMVGQVLDRTIIKPNKTMARAAMLVDSGRRDESLSVLSLIQEKPYPKPWLRIRNNGGAGRVLLRRYLVMGGERFVTTMLSCIERTDLSEDFESSEGPLQRILRIVFYRPSKQESSEIKISSAQQKYLLNSDSHKPEHIWNSILSKLSLIDQNGVLAPHFNAELAGLDVVISGSLHRIAVELLDSREVKLKVSRGDSAHSYVCKVSLSQLVKLRDFKQQSNSIDLIKAPSLNRLPSDARRNTLALGNDINKSKFRPGSMIRMKSRSLHHIYELDQYEGPQKTLKDPTPVAEKHTLESLVHDEVISKVLTTLSRIIVKNENDEYVCHPPFEIIFKEENTIAHRRFATAFPKTSKEVEKYSKTLTRRNYTQLPVTIMSASLDSFANLRKALAIKHASDIQLASSSLEKSLQDVVSKLHVSNAQNLASQIRSLIRGTVSAVCEEIVDAVCSKHENAANSRLANTSPRRELQSEQLGRKSENKSEIPQEQDVSTSEVEIVSTSEILIFKGSKVRTSFREGSTRWHGTVSIRVFESACWTNTEGKGRRLRFVVFDIDVESQLWEDDSEDDERSDFTVENATVEGFVRNSRELRNVLGPYGQDLLDQRKAEEMALYIAKFCMFLTKRPYNSKRREAHEPKYDVSFESDRLYDESDMALAISIDVKDTEEDNQRRKSELLRLRGRKVLRLVRRINGLLLQLTVFDVDEDVLPQLVLQQQMLQEKNQLLYRNEYLVVANAKTTTKASPSIQQQLSMIRTPRQPNPVTATSESTPAFRIIGYDPAWKRKTTCLALPGAVVEIAGGPHSPLLSCLDKRQELARVVCENLAVFYPRGAHSEFELILRWSRAPRIAGMMIVNDKSSSVASAPSMARGAAALSSHEAVIAAQQAAVVQILKRPGKVFHDTLLLCGLECIVTMFASNTDPDHTPSSSGATKSNSAKAKAVSHRKRNEEQESIAIPRGLILNVFIKLACESVEMYVAEQMQSDRLGRCAADVLEGQTRTSLLRRLCRYIYVAIEEDELALNKKTLKLSLLDKKRGYLSEYKLIEPKSIDVPATRPVGIPTPFMPLDSQGDFLHRCAITIPLKASKVYLNSKQKQELEDNEERSCIVSLYSKSREDPPEGGLVLKVFDNKTGSYSVLHIAPLHLHFLCELYGKPRLIAQIAAARQMIRESASDELERDFASATSTEEITVESDRLVRHLINFVLTDLVMILTPDFKYVATLRSIGRRMEQN